LNYPHDLGEGTLSITPEAERHYHIGLAYEGMGNDQDAMQHFRKAVSQTPFFTTDQFYVGLSYMKLNQPEIGKATFQNMIQRGESKLKEEPKFDYFAVSLPTFLIFEDDLSKSIEIQGRLFKGIGLFGVNEVEEGKKELERVVVLDCHNNVALSFLQNG